MKAVWCEEIEDIINFARTQGWLFYRNFKGKHYYYVYTGVEGELLCLVVEAKEPINAKYVSIDDEGTFKASDKPILPMCAKVVNVTKDEGFDEILEKSLG